MWSYSGLNAWSPTRVIFPLSAGRFTHTADGVPVSDVSFDNVDPTYDSAWYYGDLPDYQYQTLYFYDPASNTWGYVHGYNYYGSSGSSFYSSRNGGEYVYFGRDYELRWLNYDGDRTFGSTWAVGWNGSYGVPTEADAYAFGMNVTDGAGHVFAFQGNVQMTASPSDYDQSLQCWDDYWYGAYRYCNEYHRRGTYRYGYAGGESP